MVRTVKDHVAIKEYGPLPQHLEKCLNRDVIPSAFLSKPAANPMGFEKVRFQTFIDKLS